MLETLVQIDQALSLSINHFHTPWLDQVMAAISGRLIWVPLYALLAFLVFRVYGWKSALVVVLAIVLNLVLTDQISVALKDHFMRLRPCHHPRLSEILHLSDGCGGKYGFVSSHAANTMGLAMLTSLLLPYRWLPPVMMLYALLNGYSRIYLGKHFVLDILGGYALGMALGIGVYYLTLGILKRLKLRT